MGHTSLEGTVYRITKERRHVLYISDRGHSYKMTFGSQVAIPGKSSVSESRMREIRLSGLNGGVLNPHVSREEGCLP